ncbi:MAG TPA: hypothetical protein VF109_11190 [Mycobacteriales bacterium]
MIRSPRRSAGRSRVVLAALVTAGGVVLAGCGAGQQAQTARELPTVDGASAEAGGGTIDLRNVAIEYPDRGVYRKGAVARLRAVLVNNGIGADALVEVRTAAAGEVAIESGGTAPAGEASPSETGTPSASPSGSAPSGSAPSTPEPTPTEEGPAGRPTLLIPPNTAVSIGEGDDATAAILLRGLTQELRSSQIVPITFVFRTAGSVTVTVPVGTPPEEVAPAPTIPGGHDEG